MSKVRIEKLENQMKTLIKANTALTEKIELMETTAEAMTPVEGEGQDVSEIAEGRVLMARAHLEAGRVNECLAVLLAYDDI